MADDIVCHWHGCGLTESDNGWSCPMCTKPANVATMRAEIERLRAELADAYDACRYALADSPRWQALAETVVHTYEENRRG